MDNFSEVYRIEAVSSLLHAISLSENLVGETPNLNQGLCLLGEILDDVAKKISEQGHTKVLFSQHRKNITKFYIM